MNHQYRIINHCIKLLRQSKISELQKHRVEFRMIQLKRLLLNEHLPVEVTSGPCSTEVFDRLLADMDRISRGEGRADAVDDFLVRLNDVLLTAAQKLKEDAQAHWYD